MENRLEDKQARALKTRVRITKTLLSPEIGALIIGIVLAIITQMINPNFLSARNILGLLKNASFIGVVAIGQALIIMSGEMDLSVGNVAAFSTVVFGWLSIWQGLPWYVGLLGGLLRDHYRFPQRPAHAADRRYEVGCHAGDLQPVRRLGGLCCPRRAYYADADGAGQLRQH